ncbi:MAG TPA: hypothetical protein VM760_01395 [Sphingomicrobium sp.]|nr:hypothetical protein [Sphingomicrobium sp.]
MATKSRSRKTQSSRKQNDSLAARTGRTMKERPYVSAAIATGAVTAVAAAAAGAFFFRRSDKSLGEFTADLTSKVKDGFEVARERIRETSDGLRTRLGDSEFGDEKSQEEIAEEALSLKATGKKARKPADPVVESQTKAGAIAY